MLGGSPIRVAVPCRLLETAIAIIIFIGFILNFFANDKAMGATIKTVATFSTNAEIKPVRAHMLKIAQAVFFALSTIISAIYAGTRLSIKIFAITRVPTNILITFQLTDEKASLKEMVRLIISRAAEITAMCVLFFGRNTKRAYAARKIKREVVFSFIVN
jgi:hypothetical protein